MSRKKQRDKVYDAGSSHQAPYFSVVIPTFNRAPDVGRAIQSVLDQSYTSLELIVVDDGSSDDTPSAVSSFDDRRIRYERQSHAGVSAARNRGAELASGSYLCFLDSDDEVKPVWLETMRAAAEQGAAVVCVGMDIVTPGAPTSQRLPIPLGDLYHNFSGLFLAGCFALRRELFARLGGYDRRLGYSENTELALRLTSLCAELELEVAAVRRPLMVYHKSPTRWAGSRQGNETILEAALYIADRYRERYLQCHPGALANYCAVAAVNAARLGRRRLARQKMTEAIRLQPWHLRHYVRWVMTLFPKVSALRWRHTP